MFRLAMLQFNPRFGQPARNCARVLTLLRRVRADLVVLPELAFTGYLFRSRDELRAMAEVPAESAVVAALSAWCRERRTHLITGFAERARDRLFNSAILLGPRGQLATYRKLHLFDREPELFDAGDRPLAVTPIRGLKVGVMICFDYAFPEVARTLALLGADLLAHPSNLVLGFGQGVMRTRCFENGVFAVTANRTGSEHRGDQRLRFTGRSQVIGPRGELVARLSSRSEAVTTVELDPARARDKWVTASNHLLNDRRQSYYRLNRGAASRATDG